MQLMCRRFVIMGRGVGCTGQAVILAGLGKKL